jgi:hypothetical protein
MTVNELRIGNYLFLPGYDIYIKVSSIYTTHYRCRGINGIDYEDSIRYNYQPIPLTPELLEKCTLKKGFGTIVYSNGKETKEYHLSYPIVLVGNVINESYSVLYKYTRGCQNEEDFICEIEYLHQLQNLFFTLTNEELIINL